MLLHVRPRLLGPPVAELVDVKLEPFGLHLRGGVDLATRRPYQNKRYVVGCRREGQKAIDGILIETGTPVSTFTMVSRWAVAAEFLVTHRVRYSLLDADFDAASDSMSLWFACSDRANRCPAWAKDAIPALSEPVMELLPEERRVAQDLRNTRGIVIERRQDFAMPTIEPDRIFQATDDERLPKRQSSFSVHHLMSALPSYSKL